MTKNRLNDIKKQEEKLKFIDSLLASNEKRNRFVVDSYDVRDDVMKFMFAKERIVMSLYEIKQKNNTKEEEVVAGSSQFYNFEEGKIKYDSLNSDLNGKAPAPQQMEMDFNYLNEPELMKILNYADRTEGKNSGIFDLMMTQNERKIDDLFYDKYIKVKGENDI